MIPYGVVMASMRGVGAVVNNFGEKVSFIWSVADLLRGPYRPNGTERGDNRQVHE